MIALGFRHRNIKAHITRIENSIFINIHAIMRYRLGSRKLFRIERAFLYPDADGLPGNAPYGDDIFEMVKRDIKAHTGLRSVDRRGS